jgi:drug/metabolite transporter (DMT)-like permease
VHHTLSIKTKFAIIITIILWSSAFVGIRAGLQGYSPGSVALLRFLCASACLLLIYWYRCPHQTISLRDMSFMFLNGIIGISAYHVTLNIGEMSVPSGMASFIISQSPVITTILAITFLREKISFYGFLGMLVSASGIILIAIGHHTEFKIYFGVGYILLSAFCGSVFSIFQKPMLKKYDAIDVATYTIWGGTLALFIFSPHLLQDIHHASIAATASVVYLGLFPGAIAYMTWSYVLAEMPASRAISFFYFLPLIATLLGWICLGEAPTILSFIGGLTALLGVWMVNHSYKYQKVRNQTLQYAKEAV